MTTALFEAFPRLAAALPWVELARTPTPVELITPLNSQLALKHVYVKRDDLTGPLYGGNKVRKLEFLLGQALQQGASAVLTFGGAGSNHALATATYANSLGLGAISLLSAQPNAHSVGKNLLMGYRQGAVLHHFVDWKAAQDAAKSISDEREAADGQRPCVIPAGGSSALGTLGFVNAGLELCHQIGEGLLPAPDRLYVACGTMGTYVGLLLGFQLADIGTRIHAVQVTDPGFCSLKRGRELHEATVSLLHEVDGAIPLCEFPEDRLVLRGEFLGAEYGVHTEEAVAAIRCASESGLKLEGTYTGKVFAALLADAKAGYLRDESVLFWNTCNSSDFSGEIEGLDYRELPAGFHRYFENDVQPLDRR